MSAATSHGARSGFSLIELIVALVLMSVALMGIAPALFQAVNRQKIDAVAMERDAVLLAEGNRLSALPFERLDAQDGCLTSAADVRFSHTRCIRVETVSPRERRVVVAVAPADTAVPADSVSVFRTTPPLNPFNMPNP